MLSFFFLSMVCAGPLVYEGDLIILTSHNESSISKYWLKMGDSNIRPLSLQFDPLEQGFKTGVTVRVYTSLSPLEYEPWPPIYVDKIEYASKFLFKVAAENVELPSRNMTSITFHFGKVCNSTNIPISAVENAWFTDTWNLRAYYDKCSYGFTQFSSGDNIVIGPITVPCYANSSYGYFDTSVCDSKFIYGIMSFGESFARDRGIDLGVFSRRIASLPSTSCKWSGLGSVGCGSYCYTWVQNSNNIVLSTYFHELGHNLGLMHSSYNGAEYGDGGCAMGISSQVTCFNAAHNWILGWSKPIMEYNNTNMQLGKWFTHSIPPTQLTPVNYVRIVPDWNIQYNSLKESFFISYRTALGYDTLLLSTFANKVHVHSSRNVLPPPEYINTQLMYIGNGLYEISYTGIIINVTRVTNLSATVSICVKKGLSETNCTDGLDDDCDGMTDQYDTDCMTSYCGDGICQASENAENCPRDCPMKCGDGYCDVRGETRVSCPSDCCPRKAVCGDNICDAWAGENCVTCASDCMKRMACGNVQYCCGNGCNNNICTFWGRTCNEVCV